VNETDIELVHTVQIAPASSLACRDIRGTKMNLNLKRLSVAKARLEILARKEAELEAQFLELMELRGRLRQATVDRQRALVVFYRAVA
jgi:hypothetical protein